MEYAQGQGNTLDQRPGDESVEISLNLKVEMVMKWRFCKNFRQLTGLATTFCASKV